MDTLTVKVIIHLTGLLLVTPGTKDHPGTHVLFPEPRGEVEAHVTRLLYTTRTNRENCKPPSREPICIVPLDDYAVTIGTRVDSVPVPSIPDITTGPRRRVPRAQYGRHPDTRLRSRVTLWNAEVLGMCAKGWWEFNDTPMMIPNVVTYEMSYPRGAPLRILGTRIRSEVHDTVVIATPETSDSVIHIFLYSVPPKEAERIETVGARRLATAVASQRDDVTEDTVPREGSHAHHYRAYYDLIGARWWNRRPEPTFLRAVVNSDNKPKSCSFRSQASYATREIMTDVRSAGSYSCLVSAGAPTQ
jgi:hypothetical protein